MKFIFPHSHVFQGGEVAIEGTTKSTATCLIVFADGVEVMGICHPAGHDYLLEAPSYTTSKHTRIIAKRWRVVKKPDGVWRCYGMR